MKIKKQVILPSNFLVTPWAAIKRLTKEMWDIVSKEIDTLIKLDQEESLHTVKYYGKVPRYL
jgi:hypothetical protein